MTEQRSVEIKLSADETKCRSDFYSAWDDGTSELEMLRTCFVAHCFGLVAVDLRAASRKWWADEKGLE